MIQLPYAYGLNSSDVVLVARGSANYIAPLNDVAMYTSQQIEWRFRMIEQRLDKLVLPPTPAEMTGKTRVFDFS